MVDLAQQFSGDELYDNAVSCFKDCLLVEDTPAIYLLIGCTYHAKRDMQSATPYFEKIQQTLQDPRTPLEYYLSASAECALFWYQKGLYQAAVECGRDRLREIPTQTMRGENDSVHYGPSERFCLDKCCQDLLKYKPKGNKYVEFHSIFFLWYIWIASYAKLNQLDIATKEGVSVCLKIANKIPTFEHYMLLAEIYKLVELPPPRDFIALARQYL